MEFGIIKLYNKTQPALCLQENDYDTQKILTVRLICKWLNGNFKNNKNIFYDQMIKIIKRAGGKVIDSSVGEYVDLLNVEDKEKLLNQLNSFLIMEKLTR